jgi:hypothetical protein
LINGLHTEKGSPAGQAAINKLLTLTKVKPGGAVFQIPVGAAVAGAGSLLSPNAIVNAGTVSVGFGNAFGTITINADYFQTSAFGTGTLSVAVDDPHNSNASDELVVSGRAILGGRAHTQKVQSRDHAQRNLFLDRNLCLGYSSHFPLERDVDFKVHL